MADAVAGAAGKAAMSMFGPHPSITIITFWQGIVEIILRGVSMVSWELLGLLGTRSDGLLEAFWWINAGSSDKKRRLGVDKYPQYSSTCAPHG